MSKQGEVVCVTGGSGCIGSWLVRLLLHRDYTVHATVKDLKGELLDPAIKGTLNVLTAAKHPGVSRVVLTSSISAITPSPSWPSDKVKGEDSWTDIDYCKRKGFAKGHPTGLAAEGKNGAKKQLGFRIHSHGSNYQGCC